MHMLFSLLKTATCTFSNCKTQPLEQQYAKITESLCIKTLNFLSCEFINKTRTQKVKLGTVPEELGKSSTNPFPGGKDKRREGLLTGLNSREFGTPCWPATRGLAWTPADRTRASDVTGKVMLSRQPDMCISISCLCLWTSQQILSHLRVAHEHRNWPTLNCAYNHKLAFPVKSMLRGFGQLKNQMTNDNYKTQTAKRKSPLHALNHLHQSRFCLECVVEQHDFYFLDHIL